MLEEQPEKRRVPRQILIFGFSGPISQGQKRTAICPSLSSSWHFRDLCVALCQAGNTKACSVSLAFPRSYVYYMNSGAPENDES